MEPQQSSPSRTETETPNPAPSTVDTSPQTDLDSTPEVMQEASQTPAKPFSAAFIIGIVTTIAVLAGFYFYLSSYNNDDRAGNLEDVAMVIEPAAVVATVNGSDIYGRDLLQQMQQSATLAGVNVDTLNQEDKAQFQMQSLDALINTELILQEARQAEMTVSEEEVAQTFADLVAQVGGEEAAIARLTQLGTDLDAFNEKLEGDLLIQKYLDATIDQTTITVSPEEIQAAYDGFAAQAGAAAPAFADVEAQIEEQLKFQKQQSVLTNILSELRAGSDIEMKL